MVVRYRQYAANCLSIAQQTVDAAAKSSLIDMAQVWLTLADQAERNGQTQRLAQQQQQPQNDN